MPEVVYTLQEVAQLLKVSHMTVRRMIQNGELPAFKVHNQWRINKEDLAHLMQTRK